MTRLPPETFDLPVTELRAGYRSAVYFWRAKMIMEQERPDQVVTMQVFQKNTSVLCGIDEAIAILRVAAGHWKDNDEAQRLFQEYLTRRFAPFEARSSSLEPFDLLTQMATLRHESLDPLTDLWVSGWDDLEVKALNDGDEISPWEPVLTIKGPYAEFAHLESIYLGVLARRTRVATNVRKVCQAARRKPLLFFADRFDHYATQGGDGYAAKVGGAAGVATDAMAAWWGEKGLGTIPHALIAAYGGDTVAATKAFADHYPDTKVIALVDFTNNCVGTSLACAGALGDRLWGVRLDTSESMVDRTLARRMYRGGADVGFFRPTGVNPALVAATRQALDDEGFPHVRIVVSGGFNEEKITAFEDAGVPVDVYAVGSSLLQGANDFTADIVEPAAKTGRWLQPPYRLEPVT